MINKYKPNGTDLKEYKASRVKQATAKNGKPFTVFNIADKITNPDGSTAYDNYSIFSWQEDIRVEDGDKITINDIKALEVKEEEYNGKKYLKKTIFADINVISANPNKVEVVGDLPGLDDIGDQLPF